MRHFVLATTLLMSTLGANAAPRPAASPIERSDRIETAAVAARPLSGDAVIGTRSIVAPLGIAGFGDVYCVKMMRACDRGNQSACELFERNCLSGD